MDELYKKIIDQIVISGKRIREKSGKILDIGIAKKNLTEEDIRIERELKHIIKEYEPKHEFYAEEENENFFEAEDVWIADPISATHVFISGLPHYAIVVAHLHKRQVQFAVVYDPSMDHLYTAYRNKGAYLNGQKIQVKDTPPERPKVIFDLSLGWKDKSSERKVFSELNNVEFYRTMGSHAVNDCLVASGKYDGVVCFAKDSFPYFASSLIIKEAGGVYTNIKGEENIRPSDRVFVGGDKKTYKKLKSIVEKVLNETR